MTVDSGEVEVVSENDAFNTKTNASVGVTMNYMQN